MYKRCDSTLLTLTECTNTTGCTILLIECTNTIKQTEQTLLTKRTNTTNQVCKHYELAEHKNYILV